MYKLLILVFILLLIIKIKNNNKIIENFDPTSLSDYTDCMNKLYIALTSDDPKTALSDFYNDNKDGTIDIGGGSCGGSCSCCCCLIILSIICSILRHFTRSRNQVQADPFGVGLTI
jgi:hypothetical protein